METLSEFEISKYKEDKYEIGTEASHQSIRRDPCIVYQLCLSPSQAQPLMLPRKENMSAGLAHSSHSGVYVP